ncbi:MAG: alpha/beta fold hydrolase, partial [Candidatus Eremiobacteraeota bacterium]|nr:alpha/beta fold hydrolase [Candidatus Eremiobacteraeota bacterium]
GGTLAYADAGSGTPLVLIHGFPLDHSIWDEVGAALERHGRIVRPDLRGLGASTVTPAGTTLMETLASDVAALLDALGIERATLAGHGLGGYVALAFYRMYRERVDGLALVASGVGADAPQAAADRLALADRVEREGSAPLVERFGRKPQMRTLIERTDPAGAAAILRGMAARVDSSDLLDDVDIPFLLLDGFGDLPMLEVPRRLAVVLAALLGGEARGELA